MTDRLTINKLNHMPGEAFVRCLGGMWENAPWVATAVVPLRPFANLQALHTAMLAEITKLDHPVLMEFLNRHPEVAGEDARLGKMSVHSIDEQRGLSVSTMSEHETKSWTELNRSYRTRFGFPFILCLRHQSRKTALAAIQERLKRTKEEEIKSALHEIGLITNLRLSDMIDGN